MNPYLYSKIENRNFTETGYSCSNNIEELNTFRNFIMDNSSNFIGQGILNDCSLNGSPSVPFYEDNNYINKTIERPKIYQCNKENFKLAVPCNGQKKAKKLIKNKGYCVFCYNNNESEENYKSHIVRNEYNIVICPKLRLYVCPICNKTGDNAHTVKYCPNKKIITLEETLVMENYKNMFKKCNQKSIYA